MSVTIKYGKGHDDTWAGFTGSPEDIREYVISYFGLDRASVAGLTTDEVVLNATQLAHSTRNVAAALGAVAIPSSESAASAPAQATSSSGGGDPWAAAAGSASSAPAQPEVNPLVAQIEASPTVDDLKRLWAENQAAFAADANLMSAWKARGKALSTAAS